MGDSNVEANDAAIKNFYQICSHRNKVQEWTYFKTL